MSKKAIYYTLSLMVFCIAYSLFNLNQYNIDNDHTSIQSNLKAWMNRGSEEELHPTVLEMVQLDDTATYITLFQLEKGNYGYAQLTKGINGKFRIERSGHGINIASYEVVDTNKGKYMILYGRNPNFKIDHISVKSKHEDFGFISDVAKDEIFIKYKEISSDFKKPFPAKLTFFDKNNNEIFQ